MQPRYCLHRSTLLPSPFHATAFIVPQYQMTCFPRASGGCVGTGRLQYFANYSIVPQCRQCRGISMSVPSVPTVLPCRRFDSVIIPRCHEIVPTVPSYGSGVVPVWEHACQGLCLSGNMPVRGCACKGTCL